MLAESAVLRAVDPYARSFACDDRHASPHPAVTDLKPVGWIYLATLLFAANVALAEGTDTEPIKTWWLGRQAGTDAASDGTTPTPRPEEVFGEPVAAFLNRINSAGDPEIARIDSSGIDLNARGRLDITPLIWLAASGNAHAVKRMIDLGADPHLKTSDGGTALMISAREGHQAVVDALIKAGDDLDSQDANGNTALIYAAWTGRSAIVASLLAARADPRLANAAGQTARQVALLNGQSQSYDVIVKAAQTVRPRDVFEAPLLIQAAEAIQAGDVPAMLKAVNKDNVNAPGKGGATLLLFALREGRLDAYSVPLTEVDTLSSRNTR